MWRTGRGGIHQARARTATANRAAGLSRDEELVVAKCAGREPGATGLRYQCRIGVAAHEVHFKEKAGTNEFEPKANECHAQPIFWTERPLQAVV